MNDGNIIDLKARRKKTEEDAWREGHAFKVMQYLFDEMHVGFLDEDITDKDNKVFFLFDQENNVGIAMDPDSASELGLALISAASVLQYGSSTPEEGE